MKSKLQKLLEEAGIHTIEDTGAVNYILANNGYEISVDYLGDEIYAGYFSDKLKKIVQLGEMKYRHDDTSRDLAQTLDSYERQAHALEADITTGEAHNGYPNRETWIVALWLNNHSFPVYERARKCDNVNKIKGLVYELTKVRSPIASDLLKLTLDKVRWPEVLQAVKQD